MATEKSYEAAPRRRQKNQPQPQRFSPAAASDLSSDLVSGATSLTEVIELQSEFARSQMEGFIAHANRIGDIYKDIARAAIQPAKDISRRPSVRRDADDQEPTEQQWKEIRDLALKQISASLQSPNEHLAQIRQKINKVLTPHVE